MPGKGECYQMSKTTDKSKTSSKSNGGMIALVISLIVIVIALIVIVIVMARRNQDSTSTAETAPETEQRVVATPNVRTVLDEDSAESVMEQMREEVAEGMFECQMSMSWTFENGKAKSDDAYVANSTNNTHPICFDVIMQDSGENVYSSPVLPVGAELTGFALDKELPAGTYQATVMYKLLSDEESQEEISSAGFVVNIQVLN